ncbi:MAG: hypothetical protein U0821_11670 [Chloroflexota bacterium]
MDAVYWIWALTLVVALVVTVPILLVIVRIVHHLREIDRLATVTLAAAGGVAGNTETIAALDAVLAQAGRLAGGVGLIGQGAVSLRANVEALGSAVTAGRADG